MIWNGPVKQKLNFFTFNAFQLVFLDKYYPKIVRKQKEQEFKHMK